MRKKRVWSWSEAEMILPSSYDCICTWNWNTSLLNDAWRYALKNKTSSVLCRVGYCHQIKMCLKKYAKQVPLKEEYKQVYLNPDIRYHYIKLVYNDSVSTTHHWNGRGSLKAKMNMEIECCLNYLYTVFPPLYHLDEVSANKHKKEITEHLKVWNWSFHEKKQ